MTNGEPETAVPASLQKIKSINTNIKKRFSSLFFLSIFYVIKSQTSDSFDNHFDGHFAYLKTFDFSFNVPNRLELLLFMGCIYSMYCYSVLWCCHTFASVYKPCSTNFLCCSSLIIIRKLLSYYQ